MLAFEHRQRETLYQPSYSSIGNVQAPYPDLQMDSFHLYEPMANFHPLPFSYYDNPSSFAPALAQPMKPQMPRPTSSDAISYMASRNSCDVAPGLASSASSSTVGSPYSGPMHSDSVHNVAETSDSDAFSEGLGLLPTIVQQDTYNHDFVGAGFDAQPPMGHDKMHSDFVGESADLYSLQKRSSMFSYPTKRASRSVSPATAFSPSPELLTANAPFNAADPVSALTHPTSIVPVSRTSSLPTCVTLQHCAETVFKSPATPASSYPKTPSVHSPVEQRLHAHGTQFTNSPEQQHPAQPMPQHGGPFQHHFFAQSSGNFMPPLEITCSFSLLQFALPSLLNAFFFSVSIPINQRLDPMLTIVLL